MDPKQTDDSDSIRQQKAAQTIQRHWRKTKECKLRRETLSTDLRWKDAAIHAQLKMDRIAADKGANSPKERWKRAAFFTSRLQDGNNAMSGKGVPLKKTGAQVKHLETQHWLELIDGKHRYGSNLKWYHRRWQEADTSDNFFHWLDSGEGKELSLDECPRQQLEEERIQYLSAEQRLNYLATIDPDGKLRWARNNELIDTTAGHWKDSGDGKGIIPEDIPNRPPPERRGSFTSSVSSSSLSSHTSAVAQHYAGDDNKARSKLARVFRQYFTVKGTFDRLLRKTIRKNTWIYITDKNFNIFIGIKETGTFQHSTFLAGGLVTSAGLISVKDGVVYTLSPLSGHYRTTVDHFHRFIDVLKDRGVDMHKAKISKAEAALWGIEHLTKWTKAKDAFVGKRKKELKGAAQKVQRATTSNSDDDSSWKKAILLGRERKTAEPEERDPSEEVAQEKDSSRKRISEVGNV